jgi:uncharacterized protein YkwD
MGRTIAIVLLLALGGCAKGFWYRPQVAGTPSAIACPQPCPPVQTPCPTPGPSICAPCPPQPCTPPVCAPEPCVPPPQVPPSKPPAAGARHRPSALAACPTTEEQCVLDHVNRIRCSRGLRPLAWSPGLFRAAQAHSDEQCLHGYMGHGSPDPNRATLLQRMRQAGYDGTVFGEVVAWGYTSPTTVVEGWMNSRDHRAILTDPELKEVGFSRIGEYWTGNFGTPRAAGTATYAAPTPYVAAQPPARSLPPAYTPVRRAAPRPTPRAVQPQPATPPTTYSPPAPRPPVQRYFQPTRPRIPLPTFRVPSRGG